MNEVQALSDLAAQQAALAAALVSDASAPEGFDARRIAMASKMLLRKRTHAAVASWPVFARAYGPNLERDFAAYAQAHPMSPGTTPRADFLGFAQVMDNKGKLPDAVLRVLCAAEARYFLPSRRGPFLSLRLPLLGVLTIRLPKLG